MDMEIMKGRMKLEKGEETGKMRHIPSLNMRKHTLREVARRV
jgi:hypothetical protein